MHKLSVHENIKKKQCDQYDFNIAKKDNLKKHKIQIFTTFHWISQLSLSL